MFPNPFDYIHGHEHEAFAASTTVSLGTLVIGMVVTRLRILFDIELQTATMQVTTLRANTFGCAGIYDPMTLGKIIAFDGFDGTTTGAKCVTLAKPIVLKAGVYLFATGSDGVGGSPFVFGFDSANFASACVNAAVLLSSKASAVGVGGICPDNLGPLRGFISGARPMVIMKGLRALGG